MRCRKICAQPPIKLLFALGIVLLETIGRKTGKARRTRVGNARIGNQFWIVAEHGMKAIARFRIVSQLLAQTQLAKDVRVVETKAF